MDELRALFTRSGSIGEWIEAFRTERLHLIINGAPPVPLADESDGWVVHVIPSSSHGAARTVDLKAAAADDRLFRPLGETSSYSPRFNVDGFLAARPGAGSHGYTQVFRDGRVESVLMGELLVNAERMLPAPNIRSHLIAAVPRFIDGLSRIGATPPYYVAVSIWGVGGARVVTKRFDAFSDPPPLLQQPRLILPVCVIPDLGTAEDYQTAMKAALDALWNAGGEGECNLAG